jgi:hypothetical protein
VDVRADADSDSGTYAGAWTDTGAGTGTYSGSGSGSGFAVSTLAVSDAEPKRSHPRVFPLRGFRRVRRWDAGGSQRTADGDAPGTAFGACRDIHAVRCQRRFDAPRSTLRRTPCCSVSGTRATSRYFHCKRKGSVFRNVLVKCMSKQS